MKRKTFLKLLGILPFVPVMTSLSDLRKWSDNLRPTQRMPLLFLGHGNPMYAIEENQFVQGFREVAKEIPKPSAILCVSAHWYIKGTKITAMNMPPTIHDFGGFPQALFDVQYPAKGNPELAAEVQTLLAPSVAAELDATSWGLDHGTWSVLKHLYPLADVPVIQMSIDFTQPPAYHFQLAAQLSSLRDKGVLIVGSGNIVHNLRLVDFKNINKIDYGYDWAAEARQKVNTWLLDGNMEPLINYHKQGKALELAAPSPDHYLPLLYVLGLKKEGESIALFNDNLVAGALSMTSVAIG